MSLLFRSLLATVLLPLLGSCESEKRHTPEASPTRQEKTRNQLEEPISEGIVIPFEHHVVMDVTTGSSGRTVRKLLIQTIHLPVEDARKQLSNSLEFAGFHSLGSMLGANTEVQTWSQDGKPLKDTRFGLTLQTTLASDSADPAVTGTLTLDIYREAQ